MESRVYHGRGSGRRVCPCSLVPGVPGSQVESRHTRDTGIPGTREVGLWVIPEPRENPGPAYLAAISRDATRRAPTRSSRKSPVTGPDGASTGS